MNKQAIKHFLISLVIIGTVTGVYFGVRYMIKLHNTVILTVTTTRNLLQFVNEQFPEQVKLYEAAHAEK